MEDKDIKIIEDIKRCNELIKTEHSNWIGTSNQKAIENILIDYKQKLEALEKVEDVLKFSASEIERLQQENAELRRGQHALMKKWNKE